MLRFSQKTAGILTKWLRFQSPYGAIRAVPGRGPLMREPLKSHEQTLLSVRAQSLMCESSGKGTRAKGSFLVRPWVLSLALKAKEG